MRNPRTATALILIAALLVGCDGDGSTAEESPNSLTILAHDSFAGAVDETTFQPFTEATGIAVEVLAGGDAGAVVNQAVLTKGAPLADVMFGIDDTFLSRAIEEEIFVPHNSDLIATVPETFRQVDELVTPIDYGDVCLNYDKAYFQESGLAVPDGLDDLASDTYAGLVTVEHPATSSPGLAFMMATIDVFGEDGWLDWWSQMREGGVKVVSDWETAYNAEFSAHGGTSPIVVSYASSPPAEVMFAAEPLTEAPTGVIESGCYRQVEYAGVLAGTDYPEAAGELIDFMLSVQFQEGIPETWFVFPANGEAALPGTFVEHTVIPESPTELEPGYIAENRDEWIDQWVAIMEG